MLPGTSRNDVVMPARPRPSLSAAVSAEAGPPIRTIAAMAKATMESLGMDVPPLVHAEPMLRGRNRRAGSNDAEVVGCAAVYRYESQNHAEPKSTHAPDPKRLERQARR